MTVTLRLAYLRAQNGRRTVYVIVHDEEQNNQVVDTSGQGEAFPSLYDLLQSLHLIFPTAAERAGKSIHFSTSSQ